MAAKKKKKMDKQTSDFITKVVTIAVSTLALLYLMGQFSAVLNENEIGFAEALSLMPEHITTKPLDFITMNPYVAYFGGLGYILFFVMAFSKQSMPQAEMKGIEHGSSDFQTDEERIIFRENNTTEILDLDLRKR